MKIRLLVMLSLIGLLVLPLLPAQAISPIRETHSEAGLTFGYPLGWTVTHPQEGIISLQSSPEVNPNALQTGEVVINFWLPFFSSFAANDDLYETFYSLSDTYQAFETQFGEPEELEVSGYPALQAEVISDTTDGHMVVFVVDSQVFVIFHQTAKGAANNSLALFGAILETVTYETNSTALPTLTQTYNQNGLSFQYPEGWLAGEADGVFFVKNSPDIDINQPDFASGEFMMIFLVPAYLESVGIGNLSPEELVTTAAQGEEDFTISNFFMNNSPAALVEVKTANHDSGALVISFEGDTVLIGYNAASGEWQTFQTLFFAIAETVTYRYTAPTANPDGTVSQWAIGATATSEYSPDSWNAAQATGEPNTTECADLMTAWASQAPDGVDSLTVTFAEPVQPTQVNIHQTYNPGAIVSVELITPEGENVTIRNSADPLGNTPCPGVFSVDVSEIPFAVNGVRINLDQTLTGSWNEIDAVELIGYPVTE